MIMANFTYETEPTFAARYINAVIEEDSAIIKLETELEALRAELAILKANNQFLTMKLGEVYEELAATRQNEQCEEEI